MFKLFVVSTLVALAQAVPYGKSYGYAAGPLLAAGPIGYSTGLSYGGLGLAGLGGGFGLAGLGGGLLAAGPAFAAAPAVAVAAAPAVVPAAVQSRHLVSTIDVPSGGLIQPTTIDVGASQAPINMIFRSASSHLAVQGVHQSAPGSVQESASQDEPHLLRHTVTKPVIQEVNEIVIPQRRITQQVQPVQEEIQTVVARGTGTAVAAGGALIAGGAGAGAGLAGGALIGGGALGGAGLVAAGPAVGLVSAGPAVVSSGAGLIGGGALIGSGYGYSTGYGLGGKYLAAAPAIIKKY